MTKTVQRDISQNKYEEKKTLKHVEVEESFLEDKAVEIKRKVKGIEEADK